MTTSLDKTFMLTGQKNLLEPFDLGRPHEIVTEDKQEHEVDDDGKAVSNSETSILHEFAMETSAHGCAHVTSEKRGPVTRVLWAMGVLGMLGAMIYTLYSMLAAYDQYPVNTVAKVSMPTSLPFPRVVICNINQVDTSMIPYDEDTFRRTKVNVTLGLTVNDSDPQVADVLEAPINTLVNASWVDSDQFLDYCLFNDEFVDCTGLFVATQDYNQRCISLNTSHSSLTSVSSSGPDSGLRLLINVHQDGYVFGNDLSAGIKMYIHEAGIMLGSGVVLSPGFSHYVGVKPVQFRFLPKPYMAYGDEACTDVSGSSFSTRLRLTDKYSYAACNLECTLNVVADICGCRSVLNEENNSTPLCSMWQFYTCYDEMMTTMYSNISAENRCQCPRECEYTEYDTQISSAYFPSEEAITALRSFTDLHGSVVRKNYMELRIYLDKLMLKEVVHEPVYTYITVMGTIGGQMGFFIGASVLTVAELIELCLRFLFRFLCRISNLLQYKTQSRVIPAKDKAPSTMS